MADNRTQEQRHANMSAIHSAATKPELKLRLALWHLGYRYRVNDKRLPGKPDIVLPKYRTVIFVHGCFWHGHKGCKYYTIPKTNTDFWTAKVARNQERDQEVWRRLEAKGWSVIIVWECQLKKAVLEETIDKVTAEIKSNGEVFRRLRAERMEERVRHREERAREAAAEHALMREVKLRYPGKAGGKFIP